MRPPHQLFAVVESWEREIFRFGSMKMPELQRR
jgi:hypothetical protein